MPEYEKETTEQQRLEKEQLEDLGTVWRTRGPHAIHCLTVIGQVVLGGGHSIGIPLAVSARRSFIVPTATMTVHPVRHSGMILGVPQTMRWFEQMQERITGFVAGHSGITAARYSELMLRTGELVMDVGTMLDGKKAVKEKLIDQLGGISDALDWLYREIERAE